MMRFEIALNDLRFHSRIGVAKQERTVGNEFAVSLTVSIPYTDGAAGDDLSATISYADIYDIVKAEMGKPRQLLEAAAAAIARGIREKWPEILSGHITICKSTPPITGITGNATVTLIF